MVEGNQSLYCILVPYAHSHNEKLPHCSRVAAWEGKTQAEMDSLLLLGLLVLLSLLGSDACLLVLLGLYPAPWRQLFSILQALLSHALHAAPMLSTCRQMSLTKKQLEESHYEDVKHNVVAVQSITDSAAWMHAQHCEKKEGQGGRTHFFSALDTFSSGGFLRM